MSRYLRNIPFDTTFDGDKVRVTFSPIELADVLKFQVFNKDSKLNDTVTIFQEVCPKYVTAIEGLVDAAGAPIEKDIVFKDSYFVTLMMDIGQALLKSARPADPKPPASPSPDASAG